MKHLLARKGLMAAIIFFALVAIGGAALATSNNWENPFNALNTLVGTTAGIEGAGPTGETDGERAAPPDRSEMAEGEMPEMGEGGSAEGISLSWSQIGGVLYNIWYLFAAAAFVMVISIPVQFIRQQLRRLNLTPKQAAAHA
ncbi:MAG: hypothetical protein KC708_23945 [Anaerolineae bacterium]|nr:hypothetical protein [Anaerolineae bacterium]